MNHFHVWRIVATFVSAAGQAKQPGKCSLWGIGQSFVQHVPDSRGQLAHHGNAGGGGSSSAFDAFEPIP